LCAVEVLALVSAAVWLALDHRWLIGLGVLADATMIAVWALWINPTNQQVNRWRIDALPPDWARLRDRWEMLHTIRAGLSLIATCALLLTVTMS
jgi:hypothetical protein